jgi:hypothetical protein
VALMSAKEDTMSHMSYHHYGASVIHAPITQLRRDMHTALDITPDALRMAEHTTTTLQEVTDHSSGAHVLTYCSTVYALELAEYSATCTLASVADAPHTTFVEWMREYRPTLPADHDQIRAFVSTLIDQDRAIASRLEAEYGSSEVFYIDYTLGGA